MKREAVALPSLPPHKSSDHLFWDVGPGKGDASYFSLTGTVVLSSLKMVLVMHALNGLVKSRT